MARIGNETRLILKLARAKVAASKSFEQELDFRGRPGNYPEKFTWQEALAVGYRLGVNEYQHQLNEVVLSLEEGR